MEKNEVFLNITMENIYTNNQTTHRENSDQVYDTL